MKHYLLSFLLSFSFFISGFSQNLIIRDKNGKDISNQTLIVYFNSGQSVALAEVILSNLLDQDLQVWVRKFENETPPGTRNVFFLGNSFHDSDIFLSENSLTIPSRQSSQTGDFVTEYYPEGSKASSVVSYEFFSPEGLFDPVSISVKFVPRFLPEKPFELSQVRISDPRPNPARDFTVFDYNLPQGTNSARLVVRNLTGSIVIDMPLDPSSSRHRLETSPLNNGIFLYSFLVNEHVVVTKKLVVNR